MLSYAQATSANNDSAVLITTYYASSCNGTFDESIMQFHFYDIIWNSELLRSSVIGKFSRTSLRTVKLLRVAGGVRNVRFVRVLNSVSIRTSSCSFRKVWSLIGIRPHTFVALFAEGLLFHIQSEYVKLMKVLLSDSILVVCN